jgi:hypothetical protein
LRRVGVSPFNDERLEQAMSRKAGTTQRIDGLIAELRRLLDAAALLIVPFPAKRNVLRRPVPVYVDATRNRRKRIVAAHRR